MTLFIGLTLLTSCNDDRGINYETPKLAFKTTIDIGLLVPEGWEVTFWAESPSLYNPTNMDVNSKGRIWVTEAAIIVILTTSLITI